MIIDFYFFGENPVFEHNSRTSFFLNMKFRRRMYQYKTVFLCENEQEPSQHSRENAEKRHF